MENQDHSLVKLFTSPIIDIDMKSIENINRVDRDSIKLYDNINGFDVMEELFLFKGEDRVCKDLRVDFKFLLDAAFVLYGLKVNATNKLYVAFYLNKFYKNEGLITPNGSIKVPVSIYDKVKSINDKYRNK